MTTYVCKTLGIARDIVTQAEDGDTIQLVWRDANAFSRAAVESHALMMGVDVLVVVAPANSAQNKE